MLSYLRDTGVLEKQTTSFKLHYKERLPLFKTVNYQVTNAIATIELARPEVLNAFNDQMHDDFYSALREAKTNDEVRVIVVKGSGKGFSTGADLKAAQQSGPFDVKDYLSRTYNRNILLMTQIEKPILAAIQGPAVGAGLSIALACDFRIASNTASFSLAFMKIGLIPDAGSHFFLPRLVGLSRALELAALAETLSAHQAEEIGLVNKVVEPNRLKEEIETFAIRLSQLPTKAFSQMKQTMLQSFESNLQTVLGLEADGQEKMMQTADHREGITAFMEKRHPNFVGK